MSQTVFIALGSNLGNRLDNLRLARLKLADFIEIEAASRVFETPPWGYAQQPAFLNQVIHGKTELSPQNVLAALKHIELDLGRQKTFRYGPRLIDLDLLFYNDWVLESKKLTLPHPHLHERAFVLVPLLDIASNWVHPVLGKTIRELAEDIDQQGILPIKTGYRQPTTFTGEN
jgi:2-amino-4-hydroxy-6-hydroxymethyldihydropteridine diphosphokinase